MAPRLRLFERQAREDEQERRVHLDPALGSDLLQSPQNALFVVGVLAQDFGQLLTVARRLLERDHAVWFPPRGAMRPARSPATRNRTSGSKTTAALQGAAPGTGPSLTR